MRKSQYFPFQCWVLNIGTTVTIFITSLVWRGPWRGIEPGTSRTRCQHSTTRISRRRYFKQMKANPVCYTNMHIIYKLANMHILEYVKHYFWFWGKIANSSHTFFFIIFLYIWKGFELFLSIILSWQKSVVLYMPVSMVYTLMNTNILYDTTIYTKCYIFIIGYFLYMT